MDHDIIVIGRGLAGAALGKALRERGIRVLSLEREVAFKDRVRGEARALGLYEPMLQRCGQEIRWWDSLEQDAAVSRLDLIETTPPRAGCLTFSHPAMQTVRCTASKAG